MQESSLFSTPSLALLFVDYFFFNRLFDDDHSDWCEVISHCGFDMHFSDSEQCRAYFHVSVSHLFVFGEMSV